MKRNKLVHFVGAATFETASGDLSLFSRRPPSQPLHRAATSQNPQLKTPHCLRAFLNVTVNYIKIKLRRTKVLMAHLLCHRNLAVFIGSLDPDSGIAKEHT